MPGATILVVDDEPAYVDAHARLLPDEYEILTAMTGEEAIELLDPDVDIVLLDRRMPGMAGEDVLDAIADRGLSCRVAMLTAVDPDFDVVDLDVDDYLVKPVSSDELRSTVETLLALSAYDEELAALYSLASKKAALESAKSRAELETSDEYAALVAELDATRERADDIRGEFALRDGDPVFSWSDPQPSH